MVVIDAMTASERRSVTSVALLYAFRMLGLFMVLPVLALYAAGYSASTPMLVGLALGIYGLSQASLQIPLGMLSDRIGRKPVIIGGLVLFGLGSMVAATTDSIYGIIAGRFLQGSGAIASTLTALMADLTREQHRSKAMAAVGASIGVSFAVALVIGPVISGWVGLSGLFAVTAVLAGIGIGIVLFVVPSPQRIDVQWRRPSLANALRRCLADRELLRLDTGIFSLHFMLTAIFVVVPTLLEQQGLSRESHWQVYLPLLGVSFLIMVPLMLTAERIKRVREVFVSAVMVIGLSLLAAGFSIDRQWGFLLALFGFFIAFNLLEAYLPSLVSKTVDAGARGTAMGVYSSCQFAGAFCGGVGAGWVLHQWGPVSVFLLCVAVAALWFIAAWGMRQPVALSNYAIALGKNDEHREETLSRLRQLPGVVDITVVAKENMAYLRVSEQFDQSCLNRFVVN